MMAYSLGVICYGWHEAAAVVIDAGRVLAAAEEERFSRKKYDASFPRQAIAYCLERAGITPNELSSIGYGFNPRRRLLAKSSYVLKNLPASLDLVTRRGPLLARMNNAAGELRRSLGYSGPLYCLNHHLCHAASTFFASRYDRAAILTLDGAGDWESCWWGEGQNDKIAVRGFVDWPNSLGHVYAAFTEYLGFEPFADEYKVMGLAAYGSPSCIDKMASVFYETERGYQVNFELFQFQFGRFPRYSTKLVDLFGPALTKDPSEVPPYYCDLAASLQLQLERVVLHLVQVAVDAAGSRNLCLAGGVAMNSVANGKILANRYVDSLYIPPCASDAGTALGAAYLAQISSAGTLNRRPLETAQLGPDYGDDRIQAALNAMSLQGQSVKEPVAAAAELLANGHVVGWFNGRMEYGQRALGSRSILADPRRAEMRDIVNRKVKFREAFRPFGLSILKEKASEFFDSPQDSPFMTQVCTVLQEKRSIIPAVIHVDGTARLQTVEQAANPAFWDLIYRFFCLTGVPLILNTSFNVKGQPIVNTPEEAIRTFIDTDIDALICGRWLVVK